ncbi:MAG: helix-turn-helix transcriptional regulator [Candidatus Muirbacterium halophilum]|nr:helix-turn-helix transcriptional regulator [Candidatus Muirbacterium halophilum]MCK9475959.1 helix-turn-helix transcriptional regulator [Candidatus Muirbacterium halophilum]
MNIQIINEDNIAKFAVINWNDFINLAEILKKNSDIDLLKDFEIDNSIKNKDNSFLNPLKKFRLENDLSQKELAEILEVSQPYIAKLEKKHSISNKTMEKIEKSVSKNSSVLKGILKIFS